MRDWVEGGMTGRGRMFVYAVGMGMGTGNEGWRIGCSIVFLLSFFFLLFLVCF